LIVYPYSLYIAYAFIALTNVIYLATFIRIIRSAVSQLLALLIVLNFVASTCMCFWLNSFQNFQIDKCNSDMSGIKKSVWITAIMLCLSWSLYVLAHWLFALKYWSISLIIQCTIQKVPSDKKIRCLSILNILVIANIFGWSIVDSALFVAGNLIENDGNIMWAFFGLGLTI